MDHHVRVDGSFVSRRQFLRSASAIAGVVASGSLLAACGQPAAPASTSPAGPVGAPTGAAASRSPSTGQLTHAQKDPVASLDSANPGGTLTAQEIFRHIYDGLLIFDENLQVHPNLAESWKVSTDEREWTFALRKGVTFHDGTPFNAQAVKFHFDRILDPKQTSAIRNLFSIIDDIRAPDDHTVVFHTRAPFGPFLNYMAHGGAGIVSPAAVAKWGKDYPLHPVGTGPFKLADFVPGESAVLVGNDGHWSGKPRLARITFKTIPEDGARSAALETGEVDTMIPVPLESTPRLKGRTDLKLVSKPVITMMYLGFNLSREPFGDLRVRQALSMAIDRKGIVDKLLGGFATVADSPMAKGTFGYSPSPTYDYDPPKAKQILAAAGWKAGQSGVLEKDGKALKFTLWTPQDLYLKDVVIAQAAQAQLEAVGAKVDLKKVEAATWFKTLKVPAAQSPYDMFMWSLTPSTGDGYQQLNELSRSDADPSKPPHAWNLSHYKNPQVDHLIDTAGSTTDQEKRKVALKDAQAMIMQDAPLIFLYSLNFVLGQKSRVQGVRILPNRFVDFREASVSA